MKVLMPFQKQPKAPAAQPIPDPPSIDDAAKARGQADRIKRRKGTLANIFGGSLESASSPSVGTKQLLGS